jgi:uncharacterized membrane protein
LAWIFVIYGFLGWCVEVCFATVKTGKFVNRGFLNGPFCPIYGFGVMAVVLSLTSVKSNLLLLFIGSFLLATLLEFVTGYILERNFNQKWWDYSDSPLNIKGYVCFKMSFVWGLACIGVVYILQPITLNFIDWLPNNVGVIILCLFALILVADTIVTVMSLLKLKREVYMLEETGDRIRSLSDLIGKNISNNTINAMDLKKRYLQEIENLNNKYQAILNEKVFGYERITKAFPKLRPIKPKVPVDVDKLK